MDIWKPLQKLSNESWDDFDQEMNREQELLADYEFDLHYEAQGE